MKKQVITIAPDGSLCSLQHSKGEGIDFRQFGRTEVRRISDIEWDEQQQAFCIVHPTTRKRWNSQDFQAAGISHVSLLGWRGGLDLAIFFHYYDEARAAEVAVAQARQVHGVGPVFAAS